jgi:hypothetical protein
MPPYVINKNLRDNVNWNVELIANQLKHAQLAKGRARSGYYKLAVIIGASIVEAFVHLLLLNNIKDGEVLRTGKKETYECSPLPKNFYRVPGEELVIAKRRDEIISIKGNTDFVILNRVCLEKGLFTKRFFRKVEAVRTIRNKVHIQGLGYVDRSYTRHDVEKIAMIANELLNKLNLN